MAQLVLGLGTSHTPMLLADLDDLPKYEENDRRISLLDREGARTTFDTLLTHAANSYTDTVHPEALTARHLAAHRSLESLRSAVASASLDALIVIGDDQKEMLPSGEIPEVLVYERPTLRYQRPPHAPGRPDWVLRASDRYYPTDTSRKLPVDQALARHVKSAIEGPRAASVLGIDLETVPMGHAFAFVYAQLMPDQPIPIVPVLLNALYAPTQPTAPRCIEIGQAIATAVGSFPGDARVGLLASGGLSHFVVDESLDGVVTHAVRARDLSALAAIPDAKLNSGNGEIRNWICAAGALGDLPLERFDYIPGYRTQAGTGVGLGFAIWRA